MSLLVLLSRSPTHSPSQDRTLSLSPAACLSLPLPVSLLCPPPFCWSVSQPVSVHPHAVFSLSTPPLLLSLFFSVCLSARFPLLFFSDRWVPQTISRSALSAHLPFFGFFLLSLLCTIRSLMFAQAHQVTLGEGQGGRGCKSTFL